MKLPFAAARLALLACVTVPGLASCHAQKAPASTQQKIAALQGLRDSGVLTDDEYQQKVAALKATGSRNSSAGPGATADAHSWHLKLQERSAPLTDYQTGQTRNIKMMSMLLPDGWTLDQGATKNFAKIDCADTSGRIAINAINPDKTMGIYVIPASASMSTNNQNFLRQKEDVMHNFPNAFVCQNEQPMGLAENFQQGVPKLFADAQIVGQMEPVPGLSAELPGIVAAANRNGSSHLTAEAGRIRLKGKFRGTPAEMWLVALATHRTESLPGGPVTYNDLPLLAVLYAPPGELDKNDKLLMTLLSSVQVDQDWIRNSQTFVAAIYQKINGAYATVNRIHQQMQQDNANAATQQHAIQTNSANYANQVHSAVAANRASSLDHSSQQFALYMGDQAIYKDPSSGQNVQLSSQYGHVWASTTGNTNDYILTDSPSYNPNGQAGSAGWTQMELQH
jgi:hypothetical protein